MFSSCTLIVSEFRYFFFDAFTLYLHRSLSMNQSTQIRNIAQREPLLFDELDVLQDIERSVPGSVHYSIKRYKKAPEWSMEDTGMLVYHYEKNNEDGNYLELKFCVTGSIVFYSHFIFLKNIASLWKNKKGHRSSSKP